MKEAKNEVIKRYRNKSYTWLFSYIRFWDAPYHEVEHIIPKKGTIVELGCGEGLFSNFLAISGSKRNVIGIEIDKHRLKNADKKVKNATFRFGDITKVKIPDADTIVLFHVLHHLHSYEEQEKLIARCKKALKPRGSLVIVEVNPVFSYKYFITWFTDHFLVPWLFERRLYSPIFFRSEKNWQNLFKKLGFRSKKTLCDKGKPFSHILYVCTPQK
jgi:2-polyprenyl-3-methyl-5-hydroxy-6-metoxy-1,4-benzoquinol methylase